MTPLQNAAAALARLGWWVFPLMPREKKPYANTTGLLSASADEATVSAWWSGALRLPRKDRDKAASWPSASSNIGAATGRASGFWVLDLDGPEAFAAIAALEAVNGALPATVEQSTGEGAHKLFRWPDGDVEIRNSAGRIGKGVDVRGEGGYIVVAPSVHPSGRAYAWAPGRSPAEVAIVDAPEWLVQLAAAPEPAPASTLPAPRRRVEQGRASPYGEAALANACRSIEGAPAGRQNSTLWEQSCGIGCLVAGEEIERSYAERELVSAGLRMAAHGKPWTLKVVESAVERAFDWASAHPRRAPERRGPQAASLKPAKAEAQPETPADAAADLLDAGVLWATALPALGADGVPAPIVSRWFEHWGLEPTGGAGLLDGLRVHPRAPWHRNGATGPALILPFRTGPGAGVEAVATLPLDPGCGRIALFIGDAGGKAIILTPLDGDPVEPLIVALDVQDAWALAAAAVASEFSPRVVICPTVRSFAGQALGDQYGRLNPELPQADPAQAPWTWPDAGSVVLAVRRDLRPVEVRQRKFAGGTAARTLSGEAAARFWGSLADQAWRRSGANPVRILQPTRGDGFHSVGVA